MRTGSSDHEHPCVAARTARRPLVAPGEIAWIAGTSYFAGAFLLTLWMRALSLVDVGFGVGTIGVPLLAVAIALGIHGLGALASGRNPLPRVVLDSTDE